MSTFNRIRSNALIRNFASASVIQGIGMLLPLLTIPYLMKTIGVEGFALVNLALAVVTYFVVFTDYGFNLMGTRLIALNKGNGSALNRIFSNMLYAQVLLVLIGILIFCGVVAVIPSYRTYFILFATTFGVVIGSVLLPVWFFQGTQKIVQLHIITLVYRALYTLLIFTLVKSEDDILLVPALNATTSILGGLAGLLWVMLKYNLRFTRWIHTEVVDFLKQGWNLFLSALSVTSMQQLPIIILAFFTNKTIVGYYAFAEKVLLIFRVAVQLLSSVLYPKVIHAAEQSFSSVKSLLKKVNTFGGLLLILAAPVIFFIPLLLFNFATKYYHPSLDIIFAIWCLLPLGLFLKITAQQILLAYDKTRAFAVVMMTAAVVNLLLLYTLSYWLGYPGTALAVLLTEVFLIFALRIKGSSLKLS